MASSISARPAISGGESWIDRVAAVVRAADQPAGEERLREESAQQHVALLGAERLARLLVLDELERLEVAGAAHVADDLVPLLEATSWSWK